MTSSKGINFGFLSMQYQALDAIGPMDIIFNTSKDILVKYAQIGLLSKEAAEKAWHVNFHHIGETLDPVTLTGNLSIVPTTTCDTCPELDYLLIGGPDPTSRLSPTFAKFVKNHVAAGKVLFTTCTGAMALASTGILDGKNATVNHSLLDLAVQLYPKVNWNKEKQWVIDGNIWTAGGACAGMDMIAYWVEQTVPKEIANVSHELLDFESRDVDGKRALKAES
ncbi:DJ-1/PfpI family protein-like protein [Xylogone sp. PMI_703]|nr:DJ-1/PfpI family protein-like protein [Xylogone sp. PMI_703]